MRRGRGEEEKTKERDGEEREWAEGQFTLVVAALT